MTDAPTTQDAYVAALAPELRDVAQRLRTLVREAAPDAVEGIKYGMPAFFVDGSVFIYFAVWKRHVGIYPIYDAPADLEARIAPYRHAKDTVRLPLRDPIDFALVVELVRFKRAHALPDPSGIGDAAHPGAAEGGSRP